jgi:Reverse transcriptase (RNA-dependent DNA polymerase)
VGVAFIISEIVGITFTISETVGDITLPNGPWVVISARQTNSEEDNSDSDSGSIPIAMLAKTYGIKDPDTPSYKEIMKGPEAHLWRQAVQKKLNNYETRKTFTLVRPPANRKILTGKWVFKRKRNENGEIIKYKARWVLRGFEQQKGTDYKNTYTAIVRNETTRLLLSLCVVNDWEID